MKSDNYEVGQKFAITYGSIAAGIGIEKSFYRSMDLEWKTEAICNFPKDEIMDSLYTIVEYLGDGLWKDSITGVVFGREAIVHPENGINSDEPKSMLIIEDEYVVDNDAPMYPEVSKVSPFKKITPYIIACVIKTKVMGKEVSSKLAEYESMVREADDIYRTSVMDGLEETQEKSSRSR